MPLSEFARQHKQHLHEFYIVPALAKHPMEGNPNSPPIIPWIIQAI